MHEVTDVVGFDLGHGETSLCRVSLHNAQPPQIIELYSGERATISAVAYQGSATHIGTKAIRQPGVNRLHIAFKQRPQPGSPLAGQAHMLKFIEAIWQTLVSNEQIDPQTTHVFVGCPANWKEPERAAYQHLFRTAGMPHISVVPESRAALMHARHSDLVKPEEIQDSVLVIDIGSSTTDFTLISKGLTMLEDDGYDLGASLIDQLILDYSLAQHPQRTALTQIFAEQPHYRTRCELACRQAKEEYFSRPDCYVDALVNSIRPQQVEQYQFEPLVNKLMMDALLDHPAFNGKGWKAAFRDCLLELKAKYAQMQLMPSTIVITGGASRMEFIRTICAEVFPGLRYRADNDPEIGVADGLARWGRHELNAASFMREVEAYLDQQLDPLIERHLPNLIDGMVEMLTDQSAEVMKASLEAWREGEIKNESEMGEYLKREFNKWKESVQYQISAEIVTKQWILLVSEDFNQILNRDICRKYGLEPGNLSVRTILLNHWSIQSDSPSEELMERFTRVLFSVLGVAFIGFDIFFIASGLGGGVGLMMGIALIHQSLTGNRGLIPEENIDVPWYSLPIWIRRKIVKDSVIKFLFDLNKPKIRDHFQQQLSANQDLIRPPVADISASFRQSTLARAEEARWLITRRG